MQITVVTKRTPALIKQLLVIWESAVRATHHFLSNEAIKTIKTYVPQALQAVDDLIIAHDNGHIVGFMGISKQRLEMLFISNAVRGKGIGKQLLQYGINQYHVNELTVNEQNPQAVGFYQHMGFVTYKRTPYDEEGQPYPLLYMKR
ncbi:MAG: GNAT family N-acetyltransferase [Candidatus Paralactobacillus gallistercoris]|uniref:GNAT family N-acetyltransferase n=1 Tax=Candidatus Paralactobacillus gallistercoris TaxID=2838724 RepID=A0A948TJ52_9LACO|nr:GNAT family N-acetyltransferase [Candidatus Paralactobacillus gallistercoris]